jgi:maltose O-acetyltransferase
MYRVVAFAREKLGGISILRLVLMEISGLFYSLVKFFPGATGYVLRYGVLKVLLKKVDSFCYISPNVEILHFNNIRIGSRFACNTGTYLNGIGKLEIGHDVLIGSNVTISTGKHPIDDIEGSIFSQPAIPLSIVIEDGVWIGAGVVVVPGVTIREGSVVGANSVLTKDTEPWSVYTGVPAKLVRYRKFLE